jgi:hypothetical protein
MASDPPKVFISYSHDNREHCDQSSHSPNSFAAMELMPNWINFTRTSWFIGPLV